MTAGSRGPPGQRPLAPCNLAQMQPVSTRIPAPTKPPAPQPLRQPDIHGALAEGTGYAAPGQTGAPQRTDAGRNGGRTANCLHTGPSPETAAVSDHTLGISPLKWAMINCLEGFGNRLMPASGTGPALNKGRTVHPNPENNRATPEVTNRAERPSNRRGNCPTRGVTPPPCRNCCIARSSSP